MKEYKKIRINLSSWLRKPEEDYVEIANKEARDGWELVQVFAPPIAGYGYAKYFEVILVREKNNNDDRY